MPQALSVSEIMSKEPVTISPEETVLRAGDLMRERDVGSLLVIKEGRPIGIITEKDIVDKVVAKDLRPSSVLVKGVMSSPVMTIDPYKEVVDAARIMADNRIRRLAVLENGEVVGLITEKDIMRVWPAMLEITRQRAEISRPAEGVGVGYCESCGMFSDRLTLHDGQLVCPECLETLAS